MHFIKFDLNFLKSFQQLGQSEAQMSAFFFFFILEITPAILNLWTALKLTEAWRNRDDRTLWSYSYLSYNKEKNFVFHVYPCITVRFQCQDFKWNGAAFNLSPTRNFPHPHTFTALCIFNTRPSYLWLLTFTLQELQPCEKLKHTHHSKLLSYGV